MSQATSPLADPVAAVVYDRPSTGRAWSSVVLATFLWSSNVVAVKYILREFPAFPAAMLRIFGAGLTLALWHVGQRNRWSVRRSDLAPLLQLGVIGVACSFLLYTLAYDHTSVAHAVFIGALSPIAVLLMVKMGGQERFTWVKLIGMLVCLLGVLLLALDQVGVTGTHWLGDLLAFLGMWCFAFYTVRAKRLAKDYDSVSLNTYAFMIAALLCLPLLGWMHASVPWTRISWMGWSSLVFSATFGSAAPYLAYYYSLRTLTASRAAAFQYIQPVLSTCFGVLFLGEIFGSRFEAGAALILAGMFLAERR